MSSQDDLQTLVLTTLDKQGVIEDTTNLKTADGSSIDQLAVLGALNSLRSKDVCILEAYFAPI
jgi:phenylalanyl-tRNA synthetase alpha chain